MVLQPDGKPWIVTWLMQTGVILRSLLGPTCADLSKRKHRAVRKAEIPYGAASWTTTDRPGWHPIKELPPEWGLKYLGKADLVADDEDEGADDGG